MRILKVTDVYKIKVSICMYLVLNFNIQHDLLRAVTAETFDREQATSNVNNIRLCASEIFE